MSFVMRMIITLVQILYKKGKAGPIDSGISLMTHFACRLHDAISTSGSQNRKRETTFVLL